jgi:hypothetical protein
MLIATLFAFITSVSINAAHAAPPKNPGDEAGYVTYMEETIKKLDELYMRASDKTIPQGKAEEARMATLRLAHEAFHFVRAMFAQMETQEGAALSPRANLLTLHLNVIASDIMLHDHLPHEDAWEYVY